jgi:DNA repair exonuclease SbcCD nuclease subunit
MNKLDQAYGIFDSEGCQAVLQAGDFFDSPTVANRVKATLIEYLRTKKSPILSCWGQHDVAGHSVNTLPNSPIRVLESAGVVQILDHYSIVIMPGVRAYGASFGEMIPKVQSRDDFNILVTHRMIGNRPLFPGQVLEEPRAFLRVHQDYNLVLVGDYHYPFVDRWNGRVIINVGAIVRQTMTDLKFDLKPSVCVVSIPDLQVKTYELQIEPAEAVFDLSSPEVKNTNVLERFIEKMLNSRGASEGWKSILLRVMDKMNVGQGVKDELDSALEEAIK